MDFAAARPVRRLFRRVPGDNIAGEMVAHRNNQKHFPYLGKTLFAAQEATIIAYMTIPEDLIQRKSKA